ncbi:hypothetical protein [Gordonia aurantiaca]|uniref:hypothetical protein n=1 Tax=Gordonia sp. B21 TaxID=3151852 RepID=UPI0032641B93
MHISPTRIRTVAAAAAVGLVLYAGSGDPAVAEPSGTPDSSSTSENSSATETHDVQTDNDSGMGEQRSDPGDNDAPDESSTDTGHDASDDAGAVGIDTIEPPTISPDATSPDATGAPDPPDGEPGYPENPQAPELSAPAAPAPLPPAGHPAVDPPGAPAPSAVDRGAATPDIEQQETDSDHEENRRTSTPETLLTELHEVAAPAVSPSPDLSTGADSRSAPNFTAPPDATTSATASAGPIRAHAVSGFLAFLGLPLLSGGATNVVHPAPWTLLWWVRRFGSAVSAEGRREPAPPTDIRSTGLAPAGATPALGVLDLQQGPQTEVVSVPAPYTPYLSAAGYYSQECCSYPAGTILTAVERWGVLPGDTTGACCSAPLETVVVLYDLPTYDPVTLMPIYPTAHRAVLLRPGESITVPDGQEAVELYFYEGTFVPIEPSDGTGDEGPGDEQPGDEDPGDQGPGDGQPGDEQPGDEQPGDEQPGDEQPGDGQPGDDDPGSGNGGGGGPWGGIDEQSWEAFETIAGRLPYVGRFVHLVGVGINAIQLLSAIQEGNREEVIDEVTDIFGSAVGVVFPPAAEPVTSVLRPILNFLF